MSINSGIQLAAQVFTIFSLSSLHVKPDVTEERNALNDLFMATGGSTKWQRKSGWTVGTYVCDYAGVVCDCTVPPNCHVAGVYLSANRLGGTIPSGFLNQTWPALITIDFSLNQVRPRFSVFFSW